ncbi:MAG TPA: M23 family metallopeptidase [Kofleriaceae bacterium]|nr:M23 family metallopeptidase [Kofleriaceae bacterium]
MSRLPLIVGAGAFAWYAWSRRGRHTATPPSSPVVLPGRWVWPVPRWNGRAPTISDGFDSPRPGLPRHGGVDIMFARAPSDPFKPSTPNGSAHFVMPDGLSALAATDGVVWSATSIPTGFAVVIDHSPIKAATFYAHLEKLSVAKGDRVRAGQPIGTIGASPLDAEHLKHLHFELWLGGPNDRIDPAPLMRTWETVADPNALVARNASLVYRPVGARGEPYPEWVRALKGKGGVYVIRDADTREIVYVGSSAHHLYGTVTRHFQTWRRFKGYWKGQYGQGHDPGLTYNRDSVEVAIRLTSPSHSLDEELRLIARLKPRDNLVGRVVEDEVPF